MHLVVSTPLHIFLVDLNSREITILRSGDGYYFGISHQDGVIVLTHSGGYLQYYKDGKQIIQTETHLIQPHQIEFVDNFILVTNTGKNCISIYNTEGELCRDVYLNEITKDDKGKGWFGNHFNSVHKHDDSIFIVAHNYDKPSEIWILSWPELNVVDTIITKGHWAHNLWICEYGWVICNSKNASLIDALSGEEIWSSNEAGMLTRGLAANDEHIFVGCSKFNEREDRYWETGGFWIIDRRTMQTIEKVEIPGSGVVHEIRIIGDKDYCHNGQIMLLDDVKSIKKTSAIINLAYEIRKQRHYLQRDFLPITAVVKTRQMIPRWQKNLRHIVKKY